MIPATKQQVECGAGTREETGSPTGKLLHTSRQEMMVPWKWVVARGGGEGQILDIL